MTESTLRELTPKESKCFMFLHSCWSLFTIACAGPLFFLFANTELFIVSLVGFILAIGTVVAFTWYLRPWSQVFDAAMQYQRTKHTKSALAFLAGFMTIAAGGLMNFTQTVGTNFILWSILFVLASTSYFFVIYSFQMRMKTPENTPSNAVEQPT